MTVGSVIYRSGVFSVEMLFTAVSSSPGEDEMKSAARVAAQRDSAEKFFAGRDSGS